MLNFTAGQDSPSNIMRCANVYRTNGNLLAVKAQTILRFNYFHLKGSIMKFNRVWQNFSKSARFMFATTQAYFGL
jgi:hypothetical protein